MPRFKLPARFGSRDRRLTLLGRAVFLVIAELVANAACWTAAALCLPRSLLGLALLAWTLGLRHGLDADHISAIDNATRQLVSYGQLPITCGLWFSLGHSTIVIVVNVAIAISVDIYNKLDRVGSVGGIVGTSVSASFLFLVATTNTYFLIQAIKERKRIKRCLDAGTPIGGESTKTQIHGGGCLTRIVAPILRSVNRPWKLYPVGILFGFGFDTASSIALLAISAIAQRGPNGEGISHGKIVVLPFTAGMSLVDSLDSILMLYAYAAPSRSTPEGRLSLFQTLDGLPIQAEDASEELVSMPIIPTSGSEGLGEVGSDGAKNIEPLVKGPEGSHVTTPIASGASESDEVVNSRIVEMKTHAISSLSIVLTLLSILLALCISLIEIMGLIGENCQLCIAAAEDPNGGGLAGRWWRGWAAANDQSGYIGAAIVGVFVVILIVYYGGRWCIARSRREIVR